MVDPRAFASICVLDVGKTNVKLNAVTAAGEIVETVSIGNPVRPGPPWQHHDLAGLGDWVFEELAKLANRHPIRTFVCAAHGSGGVLVGEDPDARDGGAALPMIDYEQSLPATIRESYVPLAGSFRDRGSAIMHGATHQARQLLWMETAEPARFAAARSFLGLPQYWAWRMTGVAVSEATCLGAQSHLWNAADSRPTPIVVARGWQRLLPPFASAWSSLGLVRAPLLRRFGLPDGIEVLVGIHDSSANLYRYQAAGLSDAAILSTGTWIVGMSRATPLDGLDEDAGMTINSDVYGRPVAGALTMGGREFVHVAGEDAGTAVDPAVAMALISRGTMALPSFGDGNGFFPGSAGQGCIVGSPPENAAERRALALIYIAQLSVECLAALKVDATVVLDGSYLKDPLFAKLVTTLRGSGETLFNLDAYGVATGAALLGSHGTTRARDGLHLQTADTIAAPADLLTSYHRRWRELARQAQHVPRKDAP
jgi:sugar (pentulose or hexulose) kinase